MKILGQILLWTGFLAAAIASVSRKEYDFLPENEQTAFKNLNADAWLTRFELEEWTDKKIGEMSSDEFASFLESHTKNLNSRATEEKKFKKLLGTPVEKLSTKDLEYLNEKLEALKSAASDREQEEQNKKDGIKPPKQSEEQIALERKKTRRISKADLIKQRTVELPKRWTTVPWLWYGLAFAVGVAGVVLLRMESKASESDTVSVESEMATISSSIQVLKSNLGDLKEQLPTMEPRDVVHFIESECSPAYADFADARNGIRHKYGLQTFADIMTQFSSGERMTNRAWSAAADGYMEEVKNCIELACTYINNTSQMIADKEKA